MASTLALKLSALSISQVSTSVLRTGITQFHTQCSPLLFKATEQLWAEPMKKKKRVDPSVIAARQAKKLKKLDKEIKRLTRFGRILKPVEEIEVTSKKIQLAKERKRQVPALSFDEVESRALLFKSWSRSKRRGWMPDYQLCHRLTTAQQEALKELKEESEELYQAALQVDNSFIPLSFQGPRETPPLKEYEAPDGEYADTTRKY